MLRWLPTPADDLRVPTNTTPDPHNKPQRRPQPRRRAARSHNVDRSREDERREKKKKDEQKKELIGEISFETMFQDMAVETARLKKELQEVKQVIQEILLKVEDDVEEVRKNFLSAQQNINADKEKEAVQAIDACRKSMALLDHSLFDCKNILNGARIGVSVGDYDKAKGLSKYDIIVSTSERADSLIRHNPSWLSEVGCLVLSLIHI